MRAIINSTYVTLDGVIQNPQDWPSLGSFSDAGNRIQTELLEQCDAVLMGRRTYDGFAPVWPLVEGAFADKFNAMPKYVVSSTLEDPEWNNTTVLRGDVIEEVGKLKAQYEGDIVVHGSPQLAQTLIEHELVDELRLMVYPVIVGAGKRLFTETTSARRLQLVEARTVGDGVHILVYRPAR